MTKIVDWIDKIAQWVQEWEMALVILVGVVLVIVGIVRLATGLMRQAPMRTSEWIIIFLTIIAGGAFMFGGYNLWGTIALSSAEQTIEELNDEGFLLFFM